MRYVNTVTSCQIIVCVCVCVCAYVVRLGSALNQFDYGRQNSQMTVIYVYLVWRKFDSLNVYLYSFICAVI